MFHQVSFCFNLNTINFIISIHVIIFLFYINYKFDYIFNMHVNILLLFLY
jgi:hypothetical protein